MRASIRAAWLATAPLLLVSSFAQQPAYLNLDLETSSQGRAWGWTCEGGGVYECTVDAAVRFSGAQSVRIRYPGSGPYASALWQLLPVEATKGRHVRFSGYLKTEAITDGGAYLWMRVADNTTNLSIDFAPYNVTNGTTDWQKFTIDRDVSAGAVNIYFGGYQAGNGTAWFDNFSVEIDGVPYAEAPPPYTGEPSAEQLQWVRTAANPFWTPKAGSGLGDLWPVKGMVGNAHVVGLGEGTHGTSEFFRMKHRLLEYLAVEMGFTIFSIEAGMAEAYKLNDYVLNGVGEPKSLLRGMGYWTWNTQEVLDMILWMREFNRSGQGRLQFAGFDMQSTNLPVANVRTFVALADPGYFSTLNSAYAAATLVQQNFQKGVPQTASDVEAAAAGAQAVVDYLVRQRDSYLPRFAVSDVEWAIQNARIMQQATYLAVGGVPYRDYAMAANIDWILERNPGAKMVVWAHNMHVARTAGAMGSHLAARHGADYVAFGQVFHSGTYNAFDYNHVLRANAAEASFPGMVEYVLHQAGMPRFFLDMRQALLTEPGSSWLIGWTQYRNIGSVVSVSPTVTGQLTRDYDVLIFFDKTSETALLPFL